MAMRSSAEHRQIVSEHPASAAGPRRTTRVHGARVPGLKSLDAVAVTEERSMVIMSRCSDTKVEQIGLISGGGFEGGGELG
jgi:hypothetical protein